jgi:hypothetical protein
MSSKLSLLKRSCFSWIQPCRWDMSVGSVLKPITEACNLSTNLEQQRNKSNAFITHHTLCLQGARITTRDWGGAMKRFNKWPINAHGACR